MTSDGASRWIGRAAVRVEIGPIIFFLLQFSQFQFAEDCELRFGEKQIQIESTVRAQSHSSLPQSLENNIWPSVCVTVQIPAELELENDRRSWSWDQIPPFPTNVAIESIESQLRAPISLIFADISAEPIAGNLIRTSL
ncbi:hypothetical protein QQ045_027696 [Rhodiola kirilowii]